MFKFPKELKTVEIGGVKVGNGNPMLLIGTIFYREEKKVRTLNERIPFSGGGADLVSLFA